MSSEDDQITLVVDCEGCTNCSDNEQHEVVASKENMCRESLYFHAMFLDGFAEQHQRKVHIGCISSFALLKIIDFANGSNPDFNSETAISLLEAGAYLQCPRFLKRCSDIIISNLSAHNVTDAIDMAEKLSLNHLYSKSFSFLLWHFVKSVSEQGNFVNLSWQTFTRLVSSPHLKMTCPTKLKIAIERWVRHEEIPRLKYLEGSKKCITHKRTLPAFPCCVGRYKKLPFVFMFDPETSKLDPFLSLHEKATLDHTTATGFQVGSSGTALYIFGGEFSLGRGNWNKKVWKYDTLTDEWTQVTNLEDPRRHFSLAFDGNDSFYLLGGFGRHRVILDRMDRFQESTGEVYPCSSLPEPILHMKTFFHQGKVYALKNHKQMFVYDVKEDKWSRAFSHVNFPQTELLDFNFVLNTGSTTQSYVFATAQGRKELFCFPVIPFRPESKQDCTTEGHFQHEAQNLCLIGDIIYNFFSDQFEHFSSIESYDIQSRKFNVIFKSEDSKIDFSPYYSFGCFALIKYPPVKLNWWESESEQPSRPSLSKRYCTPSPT